MDEAADPEVNTLQLWLTAQKLFTAITRSAKAMPRELSQVLVFVFNQVGEKFSGEEYKALGGFLFLRFICPSLSAPHVYGLLDGPPAPTAQRQLILLSKMLQNLANNTLPSTKESYMAKLDMFITNNQDELRTFFDKVVAAPHLPSAEREIPEVVKKNALETVYNILIDSPRQIHEELGNYLAADDPMYQEIADIIAAGPIASSN